VGGAEVFGEWHHVATGSHYHSMIARYDMVDESLHVPSGHGVGDDS
jgi:hypothetical protein